MIQTHKITRDMFDGHSLVAYQVQKKEAAKSDYTRYDELVSVLNEAGTAARASVGIAFAYDDDRRELLQIPEVVAYVKGMFERCPHLLYYLMPDINAIRVYVFCLAGAKVASISGGQMQIDADQKSIQTIIETTVADVLAYGESIGDSAGARRILRDIGMI